MTEEQHRAEIEAWNDWVLAVYEERARARAATRGHAWRRPPLWAAAASAVLLFVLALYLVGAFAPMVWAVLR